jgi:uncharacterized membrane protein
MVRRSADRHMEGYLRTAGEWVGWGAEVAGIVIITIAVVRGMAQYVVQLLQRTTPLPKTRIRLNLGRSLALSLEFLLAADIVRTAIAPTWDDIGKLAAIATIRTGLNFFLEHEIRREGREVQSDGRGTAAAAAPTKG